MDREGRADTLPPERAAAARFPAVRSVFTGSSSSWRPSDSSERGRRTGRPRVVPEARSIGQGIGHNPDMQDAGAPLMLSVSGARGIVGRTMTPPVAAEFAGAFATCLRRWTASAGGHADPGGSAAAPGAARSGRPDRGAPLTVLLGRDSRPSGEMLAAAASAGLAGAGCRVIDLGIVTTPTVGVMVRALGAHGGLVLTASHNGIEWNGLKCIDGDGAAPTAAQATAIVDGYRRRDIDWVGPLAVPAPGIDRTGHERHVARVIAQVDQAAIRAARLRVVLDSVNGAGCVPGRMLLEELGCEVVQINGEPSGIFAHPPEPLAANLRDVAQMTAMMKADLGFAQDPDADRLAIIDGSGRYIGEEYTLALATRRVLARSGGGPVCANLSTSRMIDAVAAGTAGSTVIRTAVGEANVASAMRACGAVIGGEGNGGVIDPRVVAVRDSFTGMGLVLNLLARTGQRLSSIVDAMPRYVMVKRKLEMPAAQIAPWLERVRSAAANDARVDTCDGVRIDWPQGWVHVRPSNTEPIARVIAEASDEATANELARRVMALR